MGAINTISQVALPALPKASVPSAPIQSGGAEAPVIKVGGDKVVAPQRLEPLQKAAGNIANASVLGTSSFALFKDSTGQYITRITDRNSGKVTYIPEPQLAKTTAPASVVNIRA